MVLRLGGFHAEMSFLGAIGHLMGGSGLQQVFVTIYASVEHILSGKAISRAVRAHLLVDAVLNGLVLADCLKVPFIMTRDQNNAEIIPESSITDPFLSETEIAPDLPSSTTNDLFTEIQTCYENLMDFNVSVDDTCRNPISKEIEDMLLLKTESLASSRTAQLWIQYSDMISILRNFILAERLGDWLLHLESLREMLPFLAASGHNLYTKSASVYLDSMHKLSETNPDVYQHFIDGKHVVRRSNRQWAGLSTDLVIEQELMRSLKTSGGLTRGGGMSENQRNIWVLSRPACVQVNSVMQQLTGVYQSTGEQNKDLSPSRQSRDWKDLQKLYKCLNERNPFDVERYLINIANGMHAQSSVNVDNAKEIGIKILYEMNGKTPLNHTFRKKDQAITLSVKTAVMVHNDYIQVDPELMFQRLASFAAKSPDQLEKAFGYELCSYPPALFDSSLFLREAQKHQLSDTIWSMIKHPETNLPDDVQYVLDGGALIHKIPWELGSSFRSIILKYVEYVLNRFGRPIIVFDGYNTSSTKDMTQKTYERKKWSPCNIYRGHDIECHERTLSFK